MASTKPILTDTKKAGESLESKQFYFVQITSSNTITLSGTGTIPYVLEDEPLNEQYGTIMYAGIGKVHAAGSITAGARVACNGEGKAIEWASGYVAGTALETGESGALVSIVVPGAAKA